MTVYTKSMMESLAEVREIQTEASMNPAIIAKLKKAYEPMRGKRISTDNANKLQGIMDKFAKNKDVLIQIVKADIPFVSSLAVTRLISQHNMKGAEINKLKKEEMEFWQNLDEVHKGSKGVRQLIDPKKEVMVVKKNKVVVIDKKDEDKYLKQGWSLAEETELDEAVKEYDVKIKVGSKTNSYNIMSKDELSAAQSVLHSVMARSLTGGSPGLDAVRKQFPDMKSLKKKGVSVSIKEETELDEAPKYELYHKDFSSAMQHAYKMAKKLHGITVKPSEIDDKVASGPRKPSEGKTNKYRLEGDKGAIQVQVYNKGGNKPYELNFYKEEVELDEGEYAVTFQKGSRVGARNFRTIYVQAKDDLEAITKAEKSKELEKGFKYSSVRKEEVEFDRLPDMREALRQVRTEKPVQLDEIAPVVGAIARLAVGGIAKSAATKVKKAMGKDEDEEVEFDEGTAQVLAHSGKGQFKVIRNKEGVIEVKYKGKVVSQGDYDRGAGSFFMNIAGEKGQKSFDKSQDIADYFAKNKITEAWELGTNEYREYIEKLTPGEVDEADLDEANYEIKNGKIHISKKDYAKKPKEYKGKRGDKPTLMALDPKTGSTTSFEVVLEDVEVDEASARADAMRAMRKGKEVDPADVDIDASPEDIKGASKNIIMQIRKVVSMRGVGKVKLTPQQKRNLQKKDSKYLKTLGSGFVQFEKGQEKVDIKVAQAVLNKFNSIKKPADKEKFQAQVAKSYKDMLKVLKAGYNEEVDLDEGIKVGDNVHLGFGAKGGTGFKGKVIKIDSNNVYIKNPEGKEYKGPMKFVTKEEVELDEAKPEYEVKYAKSKKGPFKVTKFMTLDQAKEFLADVKKDGMNGIISKGGKPVKEETILDRIDRKLKERKNG